MGSVLVTSPLWSRLRAAILSATADLTWVAVWSGTNWMRSWPAMGPYAGCDGAFVLDGKRHVDNHVSVTTRHRLQQQTVFRGVSWAAEAAAFSMAAPDPPWRRRFSRVHQSNANLLVVSAGGN